MCFIAGSFKSQLIDYFRGCIDLGKRWRGAFGSFMIIKPSFYLILLAEIKYLEWGEMN